MPSFFGTTSDLYLPLLKIHHLCVTASIALFTARGVGVLAHQPWPNQRVWRRTSVLIDTALLGAGALLWYLAGYHPMLHPWLGVKLLLLVVYIGLGSVALKRGRTQVIRAVFFVLALGTVLTMVSIALRRDPWGWLAG